MSHPALRAALAAAIINAFVIVNAAADEATVVVTATRQPTRTRELLSDVTLIPRQEIEQAGQSSLGELLARQPGLQVVATGGPGAASSVFIRGANSGHTLVLVDGLRFGSSTAGQASIESIPLSQIERIEILRGTASSIYGADAIGGVIQIFTRRGDEAPHLDAYAGYGSYNTVDGSIGYSGAVDDLRFSVRAGRYQSGGFDALGNPPDQDGFRQDHLTASFGLRLADGGEIAGHLFRSSGVNQADFGNPGDSRINKKAAVYGLSWSEPATADWTSTVKLGQSVDDQATIDPVSPSLIITRSDQFVWQNDIKLPLGRALLAYEMLREGVVDSLAVLSSDHRRTDSLLAGWGGNVGDHRFQINARRDDSTQYGPRNTGSVSYGYQFSADWRGYAAVGRAFKAPTFGDLYMPTVCFPPFGCFGGNPNLRPEAARNQEAGLTWESGPHRASLVHFDNRISDLIVWAAQPFNVGTASLKGTTLSYDFNDADWQAGGSYTNQKPRDADSGLALLRRPDQQLSVRIARSVGSWRVGGEWQQVGRCDDYDFATNVRVKLGGYGLFNAFAHHALSRELTLELRGNNLTDRKYQQALNFAVPGAAVFVGLRWAPR